MIPSSRGNNGIDVLTDKSVSYKEVHVTGDDTYLSIFKSLTNKDHDSVDPLDLVASLEAQGISVANDPRLHGLRTAIASLPHNTTLNLEAFSNLIKPYIGLIERTLKGQLIIPDFPSFVKEINAIFNKVKKNTSGHVATYIPQLARIDPKHFALSVCTVDGQMYSIGEAHEPYCVQSTCKPINYCIALEQVGEEQVHQHIGREPSGLSFNALTLNNKGLPHNPMINAGAIVSCSLIKPEASLADRFDLVVSTWAALAGGSRIGFNNPVHLSEKDTADRNFALAYFMREKGAFPPNTPIRETLEFYFQCCSIEVTTHIQAQVAATLANAGVCPTTGQRVVANDHVKNCLSLMYSCGLYDFSGEYAFTVGLPAKSGVSGALMIVIPGVAGITIWSPNLDETGNSVRGVDFSKELVKKFNFHNYDNFSGISEKIDPRRHITEQTVQHQFALISAASRGDVHEIRRLIALGADVRQGDYDGRTALHLAACEGQLDTARFLVEQGAKINVQDRWNSSPLDDAKRYKQKELTEFLIRKSSKA